MVSTVQHREQQEPIKDEDRARPVATLWRPTLSEVAKAMAEGDYGLSRRHLPSVAPVSEETAEQIRAYVSDYGETLAEPSDETWNSSVSQWMGTYWEVLVDLWTIESGASDLVLSVRVFEAGDNYRFEIDSVHVP